MKKLLLTFCLTGLIVSIFTGQTLLAQEELKVGDKAPDFEITTF